jgi:uncharacterized membrane protein
MKSPLSLERAFPVARPTCKIEGTTVDPRRPSFSAPPSAAGSLVAGLFFAASLTPSLLPRTFALQGVLSGLSLAAGYGVGVFGGWLWSFLELPQARGRARRVLVAAGAAPVLALVLAFLARATEGQNSVRALMELDRVDSALALRVAAIAAVVFLAALAVARLFQATFRAVARRLRRFVPRRIAAVLGVMVAAALFWSVVDGVLLRLLLRAMDVSFQRVDALVEPDVETPADPGRTGSAASLVAWRDLGRRGREFVSSGPTARALGELVGGDAMEPIRVYVGLGSAGSIEERARLALAELERVGAFARSVLVLVTPTGTGWIDPGAIESVEHLHRGDVASVAVQYSYLPSWLTLLSEAEYGAETARALFRAVYNRWTELPRDRRPRLYLHGLSLGALNSQRSADLYDVVADPFSGALWAGPPFRSAPWRAFTLEREPGSPAWLPRFRDGSIVRFANQHGGLDLPGARWGPIRIVYLQYASDPVTFFEPGALFRQPQWMRPPRGPDVSPHLRWFPVVTMLQLAVDIAAGDRAPAGYGHVYAPEHYVDAWRAVTDPAGWTDEEIARLKTHLRRR